MKRWSLLILILAGLLISGCSPIPGAPPVYSRGATLDLPDFAADPFTIGLDEALPLNPALRKATLENGLTYYILPNTQPANRAELWLVINAGSVLEEPDQLGLAHFLEHMLFNGTKRFPESALIDFFETVGMTFGPDINAYTSYDETVYFLRFPTEDDAIVDTAFQVLEDWAGYATLSEEGIDAERGVIVEEERLRDQNAGGRIREQLLPFLLGDSIYAERSPIGDMEIIRSAPPEALRRFYQDWYRPDLMAVIAVGDFDPDQIEALIHEHFSDLPEPADPPARINPDVPEHADTRYQVISDPEFPSTLVEISFKQPSEELDTVQDYRKILVGLLFQNMLNARFDELSRQADSPFLAAAVQQDGLVRPMGLLSVSAQLQEEEILTGVEAMLTEVERVRRHGFTESELERAKREVLNFYQRLYNDRENLESDGFADEYRRNFLEGEATPGVIFEYFLASRLTPEITLQDVNHQADTFVSVENRSVLLIGPEKADLILPTEEELATVIEAAQAKEIDAYQDVATVDALLTDIPAPAAIVREETLPELGVVDLDLANGVRVLLRQTDFQEEQVLFAAISPGGSSLVSDADFPEALLIPNIVAQSGVGDVTYPEMTRLLAGQSAAVSPYIGEIEEGMAGGAGKDFLETLFQLVYLYMTEPRVDAAAVDTLQDQARAFLRNRDLDPNSALQDALVHARYGDTIRRGTLPLEEIEKLELDRAVAIYQDRFGDASDFTFFFVGAFDLEQMKEWCQIYLGNLPTLDRSETWQDVAPDPPTGVITQEVFKGQEAQSIVRLLFTGPVTYTPEVRLQLAMLENMLDILVREELREKRSGIYAASVSANAQKIPDSLYEVSVVFYTDPERVDELTGALFDLIQQLQVEGPREDLMTKAKAQILRRREEQMQQNGFWLSVLENYVQNPEEEPTTLLQMDKRVEAVTGAEIQSAAQIYLSAEQYIQVTLFPEGFERK